MQEVFEKIIEKLNSKKAYFQRFYECEGKSEHDADLNKSTQLAFDDAIEIVKQEAEQCKSIYMDGEYCWQSCWCTDRCGECNRLCNGDIDYYESYDARNNGWIPCSVAMPPVETEVFIVAKRKYRGGEVRYITTTAMYEDGTVLENDSCWRWEDIEGEWDEENDCYIIPEGWWENRHYNTDEVYNNAVDDEVVAWHKLPQPYQPKGE